MKGWGVATKSVQPCATAAPLVSIGALGASFTDYIDSAGNPAGAQVSSLSPSSPLLQVVAWVQPGSWEVAYITDEPGAGVITKLDGKPISKVSDLVTAVKDATKRLGPNFMVSFDIIETDAPTFVVRAA